MTHALGHTADLATLVSEATLHTAGIVRVAVTSHPNQLFEYRQMSRMQIVGRIFANGHAVAIIERDIEHRWRVIDPSPQRPMLVGQIMTDANELVYTGQIGTKDVYRVDVYTAQDTILGLGSCAALLCAHRLSPLR